MKRFNLLGCTALSAITVVSVSSTAYAQLEDEVIVTATKRAESASDVPITVTALGEDTLEELKEQAQFIFVVLHRQRRHSRLLVLRAYHQTFLFT